MFSFNSIKKVSETFSFSTNTLFRLVLAMNFATILCGLWFLVSAQYTITINFILVNYNSWFIGICFCLPLCLYFTCLFCSYDGSFHILSILKCALRPISISQVSNPFVWREKKGISQITVPAIESKNINAIYKSMAHHIVNRSKFEWTICPHFYEIWGKHSRRHRRCSQHLCYYVWDHCLLVFLSWWKSK